MARPKPVERLPVEIEPLLERTFSFLTEKFARRNVEVVRDFTPVGSILGDPERLQQLFLNLLINAVDAMPDGGELKVKLALDGEGSVVFCVADEGMGISARDLEHIFDPFFTSKAAGEGNGLGLTVAHGIVMDHGATIEATSSVGEGTEFRIEFPGSPVAA